MNKNKDAKKLDEVFKSIEKNTNPEEQISEEQAENIKSHKSEMKKIKIVLTSLLAVLIILTIVLIGYTIYENLYGELSKLKYSHRTETKLVTADETLLKNYLEPGKKTLVAVWASWCPHCQNEASALTEFMKLHPDYNFLVVSHDRDIDSLKTYLEANPQNNWFVIYDEGHIIRANLDPEASTVPKTYLVNDKGEMIAKIDGEATVEKLEKLYNEN